MEQGLNIDDDEPTLVTFKQNRDESKTMHVDFLKEKYVGILVSLSEIAYS